MMLRLNWMICFLAVISLANCVPPNRPQKDPKITGDKKDGTASGESGLQFSLPATDSKSAGRFNEYRLTVEPLPVDCKGGTKLSELNPYSDAVITKKLGRGCDYKILLEISGEANGNSAVLYNLGSSEVIADSQLGSGFVPVKGILEATSEAVSLGLPSTLALGGQDSSSGTGDRQNPYPQNNPNSNPYPQNNPSSNPYPNTNPNTNPNSNPGNGSGSLPAGFNVNVTTRSGPVRLDRIFTSKYLLIDFSQPGCGYCVSHAEKINDSSTEQARFSGSGACKSLTIVSRQELRAWQDAVGGAESFSGRASAEYSAGLHGFSRLFGINSITGTPTFILVDRTGRVLGKQTVRPPRVVDTYCR
ncbi:MAG: thioredoxin family protein [Proteobacteria bacterium]|nr:thioredoxin family protein [Pseudomonadota bacterium]